MKHTIGDKRVEIDWQIGETIDNHGSGCKDVQLSGEDADGNRYLASGNSQDGELVDVYEDDIEDANFWVECNVCKQHIKNWTGSTPCCGSIAHRVNADGTLSNTINVYASINGGAIKPIDLKIKL